MKGMCEDYTMYILNEKIAEITVDDELGMDNEEIMQRQSQSIMMCYNFRRREEWVRQKKSGHRTTSRFLRV